MAPFYGWGSTAPRIELLQGSSLLFTTKVPEIPSLQHSKNVNSVIHTFLKLRTFAEK